MKFEQKVVVKVIDTLQDYDDIYDEDTISEYADSDALSSAEEAFMRGYLED